MVGDFKIRDSNWNPFFPHHSIHCDLFNNIVDSMDLCLSKSTSQILTRYSDNQNDSNLVIDLMFFQPSSSELNNHMIHPKWRLSSDHVPLTVEIVIIEEHVQTKKHTIVKNSKEEKKFLAKLIETIRELNTENILNKEILK